MPVVIPSSSSPAVEFESWILDGLALNDDTFTLESINDPVPAKIAEWIKGADSNGAILSRPPLHENKVIEMRIRVVPQASKDAALAYIANVLDKLQECEQNENGLALVWSPANSTADAITFRCLLGEITDLPKDLADSGWLLGNTPMFTIRLTCLPFGEGVEYSAGTVTDTNPMQTLTITDVPGDVPALGRLVVTDAATQSRRWVCWGIESRWLNDSLALTLDSAGLPIGFFAAVAGTRSGAYNPFADPFNVVTATLRTQPQPICGLGNLSHVGAFRPHLRFYASATTMAVRLTWQALDGPLQSLSYRVPVTVGWNLVDLGLVSIPTAPFGTQRWTGQIEAYSTATGGETLDIDILQLVPAEKFGRASSPYAYTAGVLTSYDDFTGETAGTALGTMSAPSSGTPAWATSGVATDFLATDGPGLEESVSRSTTVDASAVRRGILGSLTYTDVEVGVRFQWSALDDSVESHVLARYVDSSNYLSLYAWSDQALDGSTVTRLWMDVVVANVVVDQAAVDIPVSALSWYKLRVIAYASGRAIGTLSSDGGAVLQQLDVMSTALATGGALAGGKPGLADMGQGAAVTRYYNGFYRAIPAAEPTACYSGQSIEFRHDGTFRDDATGTYAGSPPQYIGPSGFFVPPAGDADRASRIAVIARRNNIETLPDNNIADSTTAQLLVTPRFLAIPR